MQPSQERLNPYEWANRIVSESAIHRENGESVLVERAWEYSNAENAKRTAEHNRAMSISTGIEYPREMAESLERDKAKAFAACDAFVKEFDAFRKRQAEKATA